MDGINREYFRRLFLDILRDHISANSYITNFNVGRGDDIDKLNEEKERDLAIKLKSRQQFFIKKVKNSLERLEKGTFGCCSECGGEIENKRLLARPTATLCAECKEETEREENKILYQNRSHTLGRGFINDNVHALPIVGEEILGENILKFKNISNNIGLKN